MGGGEGSSKIIMPVSTSTTSENDYFSDEDLANSFSLIADEEDRHLVGMKGGGGGRGRGGAGGKGVVHVALSDFGSGDEASGRTSSKMSGSRMTTAVSSSSPSSSSTNIKRSSWQRHHRLVGLDKETMNLNNVNYALSPKPPQPPVTKNSRNTCSIPQKVVGGGAGDGGSGCGGGGGGRFRLSYHKSSRIKHKNDRNSPNTNVMFSIAENSSISPNRFSFYRTSSSSSLSENSSISPNRFSFYRTSSCSSLSSSSVPSYTSSPCSGGEQEQELRDVECARNEEDDVEEEEEEEEEEEDGIDDHGDNALTTCTTTNSTGKSSVTTTTVPPPLPPPPPSPLSLHQRPSNKLWRETTRASAATAGVAAAAAVFSPPEAYFSTETDYRSLNNKFFSPARLKTSPVLVGTTNNTTYPCYTYTPRTLPPCYPYAGQTVSPRTSCYLNSHTLPTFSASLAPPLSHRRSESHRNGMATAAAAATNSQTKGKPPKPELFHHILRGDRGSSTLYYRYPSSSSGNGGGGGGGGGGSYTERSANGIVISNTGTNYLCGSQSARGVRGGGYNQSRCSTTPIVFSTDDIHHCNSPCPLPPPPSSMSPRDFPPPSPSPSPPPTSYMYSPPTSSYHPSSSHSTMMMSRTSIPYYSHTPSLSSIPPRIPVNHCFPSSYVSGEMDRSSFPSSFYSPAHHHPSASQYFSTDYPYYSHSTVENMYK